MCLCVTYVYFSFFFEIGCYAAMKKKIYAMGGGSYGKLFESVECYDPRTQQWTAICPLKERRWVKMECGGRGMVRLLECIQSEPSKIVTKAPLLFLFVFE